MSYTLEELAASGTYEVSASITASLNDDDRLALARAVSKVVWQSNPLHHRNIAIKVVDVFNASGDRMWINVDLHVSDITWDQARAVLNAAQPFFTGRGNLSQIFPNSFDGDTLGMFTAVGALRLRDELVQLEQGLRDAAVPAQKLQERVDRVLEELTMAGHSECNDTSVREHIWHRLDRVLEELGVVLATR